MTAAQEQISQEYCRVYVSQHYEAWEDRIFENYDLQNYLETLDRLDSDVIIVTARTHNGYWFTDIGLGIMHPGLRGVDELQEAIAYFHARGKKVMAYFSTVYDKQICELHPEWGEVGMDGKPFHGDTTLVACMNSPYRESVMNMVETLFRKRDLDGMLIDMPFWEDGKVCYCESCKRAYQTRYNRSLPKTEDESDPDYRFYMKARQRANTTFVQEMIDRVHAVKPDALVYPQCDLTKVNQRNSQAFDIARIGDYVYSDLYFEYGSVQTSVATKFLTQLTACPPEIGIMTRPGTHNDTPNMMPLDQLRSMVFTILANGGAIHLFDIMWPDGYMQAENWERNAQMFREIRQRAPFLGGRSIAQVAVYHSEANHIWYGNHDPEARVMANLYGACRALLEAHIPFDVLPELCAEKLADYDVLLLPNTACLSAEECELVREYVRDGGGLVCTNRTSLLDEEGTARNNFGLADVLGIQYTESDTAAYSRVFSRFRPDGALMDGMPRDGMMTSWGISPKIKATTAEVQATITYPYTEPVRMRFINSLSNPPAVPTNWPACTINTFGRGRAVYFAGQPERDLIRLSFPEYVTLLANAVRHVMNAPEKVQVEPDQPLEVSLWQNRSHRQVVHLVNQLVDFGRTMDNAGPFMPRTDQVNGKEMIHSRQVVHHVYPLRDVKLRIHAPQAVGRLMLQPANTELSFTRDGEYIKVILPVLKFHDMIVIE